MLVLELKSSQRHPPSPKERGETEVNSNKKKIEESYDEKLLGVTLDKKLSFKKASQKLHALESI